MFPKFNFTFLYSISKCLIAGQFKSFIRGTLRTGEMAVKFQNPVTRAIKV